MEFIAADGTTQTGEGWSPGPEARSVWVLVEGAAPVAVKLPHKDKPARGISKCWQPPIYQYQRLEARYAPAERKGMAQRSRLLSSPRQCPAAYSERGIAAR
jgi:hypothetical protein